MGVVPLVMDLWRNPDDIFLPMVKDIRGSLILS